MWASKETQRALKTAFPFFFCFPPKKKKSKIQTKFPLYFPAVIIPLTNLNLHHITASPTQHRCLRMDNSCLSIGISKENIKYNKPAGMGLTRLPSAENSPERNRQKKLQIRESRATKYLFVTWELQNPGQSWASRCFNWTLPLRYLHCSPRGQAGCFVMVSASQQSEDNILTEFQSQCWEAKCDSLHFAMFNVYS